MGKTALVCTARPAVQAIAAGPPASEPTALKDATGLLARTIAQEQIALTAALAVSAGQIATGQIALGNVTLVAETDARGHASDRIVASCVLATSARPNALALSAAPGATANTVRPVASEPTAHSGARGTAAPPAPLALSPR